MQSAASSKEAHPEWHDYFEKVYHEPVPSATTVDLNTFEWFYWFAPGADSVVPLVANFWSGNRERFVGYPWRGEWGPERAVTDFGFFVVQLDSEPRVSEGPVEVMRTCMPEHCNRSQ